MKDDIQIRARPPKKRRLLAQALDIELATWENDPRLSPSERRKASEERARRKDSHPEKTVVLLREKAGLAPDQRREAKAILDTADVTRYWGGVGRYQETIQGADLVVACPKEMTRPVQAPGGSVWAALQYARHRKIATRVIMPDGTEVASS